MSENRSYDVLFRYNGFGCSLRRGTLTVSETEAQFNIKPKEGKKVEFHCSSFQSFACKPTNNTATQFDIPFVKEDTRGILHLKFDVCSDLHEVYKRMLHIFEKAGKPPNQRLFKKKGMLQSSASSGNSSILKSDGWASDQYVSSPGDPYSLKRGRYTICQSNVSSFTPPPTRRIIQENFPTSSPKIRLGVNSSSVTNDISSHLNTSPVSSRSANLISPTASNMNTRTPSRKRIALVSRSPLRNDSDEEKVVLNSGSAYRTPALTAPSFNKKSIDSPWWYRSFANIGNSCYMNSVLQLLFYTSGISTRLKRLMAIETLCHKSDFLLSFTDLSLRMEQLKQEDQNINSQSSIKNSLSNVREIIGKYLDPEFATCRQQDAHELWTKFLDFTSEEIKTYHKAQYGGDENDLGGSQEFSHVDESKPAVFNNLLAPGDLFKIQIVTRLGCNECSNVKESQVEELYDINLDISDETRCVESVSELVKKYLSVEVVEFACDRCKNLTANKSQAVKVFPSYLLFVIKRYRYNLGSGGKKTTHIIIDRDLFLNSVHVDSEEKRNEKSNLCNVGEKKSGTVSSPTSKSPLKEVVNTYHTSVNGHMDRNFIESPINSPSKQTVLDYNNLEGPDDMLDLNGNDFNILNSDEEMDCSSGRADLWNVSPLNNTFVDEEDMGTNANNYLDSMFENTQPVIVAQVINDETSKTYFKPITESLLDRIRYEIRIYIAGSYNSNGLDWYESAFSPECELSTDDAIDVEPVAADGNCLFRSLSWWLCNGHEYYHCQITRFISNFSSEFGELLKDDEQIEEHLSKMCKKQEWGTHIELSAAATMFRCPIYTYHNGSWKMFRPLFAVSFDDAVSSYFKCTTTESYDIVTNGAIYLSNEKGNHFVPVRGKAFQSNMSNIDPPKPAYVYNEKDGAAAYTLVGVINHIGASVTCGHYNAFTYDEASGVWVSCDDSYINAISESQVLEEAGRNGYMLVYKKRAAGDEMEFTHSTDYLKL